MKMKEKKPQHTIFASDGRDTRPIAKSSVRRSRALHHARSIKEIFHGAAAVFVAFADDKGQPTGERWEV